MICCVTGHRPAGFPFTRNENDLTFARYTKKLSDEIESLLHNGYSHFITGMAQGADLDFAQSVIVLRNQYEYEGITLEAALPYPVNPAKQLKNCLGTRELVLSECNLKHTVSDHYFRGCMAKRNRYMVDKADLVLAIWNGHESGGTWNTIQYARSKGKPIRYIMLNELLDQ